MAPVLAPWTGRRGDEGGGVEAAAAADGWLAWLILLGGLPYDDRLEVRTNLATHPSLVNRANSNMIYLVLAFCCSARRLSLIDLRLAASTLPPPRTANISGSVMMGGAVSSRRMAEERSGEAGAEAAVLILPEACFAGELPADLVGLACALLSAPAALCASVLRDRLLSLKSE